MRLLSTDITQLRKLPLQRVNLPSITRDPDPKVYPPAAEEIAYNRLVNINPLLEALVVSLDFVINTTGKRIKKIDLPHPEPKINQEIDKPKLLALGEYYAMKALNVPFYFDEVKQARNSNSPFDLEGSTSDNCLILNDLAIKGENIRIEVKTRRNQEGVKYLSSVHLDQFDLLCVVDLSAEYSLKCIYLVSASTVSNNIDKKYNRLIFKENMAFQKLL
jgi:hypothetical protein